METVSENTPKRKRGRPKSFQRVCVDFNGSLNLAGTLRTKLNFQHAITFLSCINKADEETQRGILGCSWNELHSEREGKLPPGFMMLGNEVGRYLEVITETLENKAAIIKIVLNARQAGVPVRDITAHFRKLRLGARKGNAMSLARHLCRAFDDYMARFPITTRQAQAAGIHSLLDIVEAKDEYAVEAKSE